MSSRRSPQLIVNLFTSKTVVDFVAIKEALDDVTVQTVFRHLKNVPYRRSYNHNGMYYALHKPERYDQFGLWTWKGIHFSVDGSLKLTVKRMVCDAQTGQSHRELQDRLHTRAHNTLLHLVKNNEIGREEVGGHFIYLHPDTEIFEKQLAQRRKILADQAFASEVTDVIVIQVLLILIHYPGSNAGSVARRLKGHSPPIIMRHVQVVFDRFNLDDVGKKKGPSKR